MIVIFVKPYYAVYFIVVSPTLTPTLAAESFLRESERDKGKMKALKSRLSSISLMRYSNHLLFRLFGPSKQTNYNNLTL